MKLTSVKAFLPVVVLLAHTTNVYGASYVMFDGVDGEANVIYEGEAKDRQPIRWTEVSAFQVRGGKLFAIHKNGKKTQLQKTGTYRLDNGRIYVIQNGKITKVQQGKRRMLPGLR